MLDMGDRVAPKCSDSYIADHTAGFDPSYPYKGGKGTGIGRYVHANGDVYEGEFKGDHAHGRGHAFTHKAEGEVYEGMWNKNDKMHGHGVYQFSQ